MSTRMLGDMIKDDTLIMNVFDGSSIYCTRCFTGCYCVFSLSCLKNVIDALDVIMLIYVVYSRYPYSVILKYSKSKKERDVIDI